MGETRVFSLNMSGIRLFVDLILVGFYCLFGSKVGFTRNQLKCIGFDSFFILIWVDSFSTGN